MSETQAMENISVSTQDEENGLLTVESSPSSGRDAATQTPQMIRHPSPTRRQQHAHATSQELSSSEESLAYEDSISYSPSAKNVELSRAMPIPDVIVEYSKDTLPLTQEAYSSTSPDQPSGFTHMAFEGKEEMVRSSSTGNFRQQPNGYHAGGPIFLQPNQQLFVPNSPSDPSNPSMSNFDRRIYYSLPKPSRKKNEAKDLQIHTQPPTPQMRHKEATAVIIDGSDFWIIPRETSSNSLNVILAPSPKYTPTDSVSGLYSISGRSTVVSNGFSEPVEGLYEMNLMPPAETTAPSTPRSVRKFEFTKMPASVDRKRRRLQLCTDSFSLLLILIGLLIAGLTPALVAPLFYVGSELYIPYVLIFLASGTLSAVVLTFAGIVGNVVWYYDETKKKLRARLHCGRGPTFHFWGNGLYYTGTEKKEKEFIV